MTWPIVVVNQLNRLLGETREVERRYLFVGNAPVNKGSIISVNTNTDFDEVFGTQDSPFRRGIKSAMINAGQGWFATVAILRDDQDWSDMVLEAQEIGSFEAVVYAANIYSKNEIDQAIALRRDLIASRGRWTRFILGVEGLSDGETWPEYELKLAQLQEYVADYSLTLVPMLFGNEPFVNAGRGCDQSVTIADTLARVQTGPLKDMGNTYKPVDGNGVPLPLATLQTLESLRYSVPMWHEGYEGYYWSDDRTLDVQGGDYQSAENVRIIDKVARKILVRAIAKIGDRSFNNSALSIAAHEQYFMSVLREMARSTQIQGNTFPGEVKSPRDGDIVIQWSNQKSVSIFIIARNTEKPLKITINLALDNSIEE